MLNPALFATGEDPAIWLVVLMGVGVVFLGLICIIGICYLMGLIVNSLFGKKKEAQSAPTPTPTVVSGALKGAGDTKFPLYSAIFCTLFVRVTLAYVVINILHLGIFYVWLATLTDLILRSIIIYLRYRSGRWENSLLMLLPMTN